MKIKEIHRNHEQLRRILIDAGSEEYGDGIIDNICEIFDYPTTNVYPYLNCDNTDCSNSKRVKKLFRVKLKKEFVDEGKNTRCWWCKECIDRNKDMVEKVEI